MKTFRIVILILCSALTLCTAQQDHKPNSSARELYDRGIQYLNQGKWEEASAQFKQALVSDPSYREAHELYQNVEYFYFEKKQSVFSEYAELLKHHTRDPLFHYLLARVSTEQQRDSLGFFKSPLALDSSFVPEYIRILPNLLHGRKLDEAEVLIEAGLRYSPNNIDLLLEKSRVYAKQGKAEESSSVLRKIIQLYPDSEKTLFVCVELADRAGTDEEKINLLEHAVQLDTTGIRGDAYSNLFELYAKTDSVKAVQFARKSLLINPSYRDRRLPSFIYDALYRIYINSDTSKAIELAKEVSRLTIRDPRMYLTFGNHMLSLKKDLDLTGELFKKALAYHNPENCYGISCFGTITQTRVRWNYEQNDGYYRLGLGSAYYEKAEYQDALSMLQSGLGKSDDSDPSLYYKIGMTYEKLSKPQDAIDAYVRSLSFKEDDKVRSSLETLASRETNLKVAIPPKPVTNIDSAIAEAQMSRDKKAPDFQLKNLDGATVSLSSFQDKVLLLDFWATWCGPCVAELPKLQELFKKYEQNPSVRFVAISCDFNDKDVQKFIEKHGYTFPVLMDRDVAESYDVAGIPALFVVDQTGLIRYKHQGYDANVDFVSMLSKEIDIILSTKNKN